MKKLFFTLLCLLCCIGAQAQRLSVGLKGVAPFYGATGAFASDIQTQDLSYIGNIYPFFAGGAVANYRIKNHWLLQTELSYLQQGFKYENDVKDFYGSFNVGYIQLPLLIQYELTQKRFRPYAELGPSIKFKTGATHRYEEGGIDYKENTGNLYHNAVFGLQIGTGFKLYTKKRLTFDLGVRCGIDLTPVAHTQDHVYKEIYFDRARNFDCSLYVGVLYQLKKK